MDIGGTFLFPVTFYVFEVEFPADAFLISVLEITSSTCWVLRGFQKSSEKQQLSKLFQPLLINFPLSALGCLMAHAVQCWRWKAPLTQTLAFPWLGENGHLWICQAAVMVLRWFCSVVLPSQQPTQTYDFPLTQYLSTRPLIMSEMATYGPIITPCWTSLLLLGISYQHFEFQFVQQL